MKNVYYQTNGINFFVLLLYCSYSVPKNEFSSLSSIEILTL